MSMLAGIAYGAWVVNAHGIHGVIVAMIVIGTLETVDTLMELYLGAPMIDLLFNAIGGMF